MNSKILLALMAFIVLNTSCSKDDDPVAPYECTTCVDVPEALAANDASSKGIYKGVFIGSTGTIKFNVANNGTDINAVMVIDGVTVNLTSSIAWISGEPYVAPFTGTLNGAPVSIEFSVGMNGDNAEILSSSIPGHPNTSFVLVKETSSALVEGFIGTYSTTLPETGIFNILVSRPLGAFGGISRETGTTDDNSVSGTIVNNKLIQDTREIGTLSGDNISGTFVDSNSSTVTINGKRVL